ncbi:MAG: response regulator transcription factor [Anaerolineae bacterium]
MSGARILLVDDDAKIVRLVRTYLENDGYQVISCGDGLEALDLARCRQPDLMVLDLMLPGMDGRDVCRVLRAEGSRLPIIMLTARSAEDDKLTGLGLGADDYVTKPFSPRELLARVRAVLRRHEEARSQGMGEMHCGNLSVNTISHQVHIGGNPVNLTPIEFRLLTTLMEWPGKAFTRAELLDRVFGFDYEGLDRTVDVHVMNLRRKIEPSPDHLAYVETVFGVGYRFTVREGAAQVQGAATG